MTPGEAVTLSGGVTVTLWDRAPVGMAPRGFCDPWWAHDDDGRTYVLGRPRRGARRYAADPAHPWAAWDVTDAVREACANLTDPTRAAEHVARRVGVCA